MHRKRLRPVALAPVALGFLFGGGCLLDLGSKRNNQPSSVSAGYGGSTATGTAATATHATASAATGGAGATSGGGIDAGYDAAACGSACGPVELCDPDHVGLDDNCDGVVDEGCHCESGQAHACFTGDPAYHDTPGCYDGTETCNDRGFWEPCIGGVGAAAPDNCFQTDVGSCHAITAPPFADVSLADGTGAYRVGALTEAWSVTCPAGVSPCPAVSGTSPADVFKPLQSGEYTVTYTKTFGDGGVGSCTFPLLVGAPGLRVELSWEHSASDSGVDLDLHVHQPGDTTPWGIYQLTQSDCGYLNCTFRSFATPTTFSPTWFEGPPAAPPTPVNWFLSPTLADNGCYNAPRGVGLQWQQLGKGCHNPRLDLDDITCDGSKTDPDDPFFCAPENINIDYPPANAWTRIGVHYFNNNSKAYDVHPVVKVFCDGTLAAQLGSAGYYDPETPVTFHAQNGGAGAANTFWLAADVKFTSSACGASMCTVQPLYADATAKTPYLTDATAADASFGPPYPTTP